MATGEVPPAGLSLKIVAIAAGEAHTLALTWDGSVYSWGRGSLGRLGTGSESDEVFPVRVEFDMKKKEKVLGVAQGGSPRFVGIAAGAYHSLALEDDGSVWSWGYNIYGQLGVEADNSLFPRYIKQFLELGSPNPSAPSKNKERSPLKVGSVKAGAMMSFAIDNQGSLWLWGSCPPRKEIQDGVFSLVSSFTPQPIWDFYGHVVAKVACGNEHVVALVSSGESFMEGGELLCYTWGNNNHGQLGLGDNKIRFHPEIVKTFNEESPWLAYDIACGAHHTAVLTHRKTSSNELMAEEKCCSCWTFGLGENGQLGHGTTNSSNFPKPVTDLPQSSAIVSVDCGLFHTCVVLEDGSVWAWGMENGLGLCPDARYSGTGSGDALLPSRISSDEWPNFMDPVQIACGAAHTVLVAHGGYKVWAWGTGRSGVLGRGNTIDSFVPCIAMWPPLHKDFENEKAIEKNPERIDVTNGIESERVVELEKKLSSTMEEMQLLQSKLSVIERYAGILHASIFGAPFEEKNLPTSLRHWGIFNVEKEWENMIESADGGQLVRMEAFYRHMLAGVKDKIMKKRIEELVKASFQSLSISKLGEKESL